MSRIRRLTGALTALIACALSPAALAQTPTSSPVELLSSVRKICYIVAQHPTNGDERGFFFYEYCANRNADAWRMVGLYSPPRKFPNGKTMPARAEGKQYTPEEIKRIYNFTSIRDANSKQSGNRNDKSVIMMSYPLVAEPIPGFHDGFVAKNYSDPQFSAKVTLPNGGSGSTVRSVKFENGMLLPVTLYKALLPDTFDQNQNDVRVSAWAAMRARWAENDRKRRERGLNDPNPVQYCRQECFGAGLNGITVPHCRTYCD
ncbi:MAG: hypothetical protein R3C52_07540 [Hyphomonadaceae bacterium]